MYRNELNCFTYCALIISHREHEISILEMWFNLMNVSIDRLDFLPNNETRDKSNIIINLSAID